MFTIAGVGVAVLLAAGYVAVQFYLSAPLLTEEDVAQMRADVAAQDEDAFALRPGQAWIYPILRLMKKQGPHL